MAKNNGDDPNKKKKTRKKKKGGKVQAPHPTLFVFEGTMRYYDDGSMLGLYTQVTSEEWTKIITETIQYKIFVDCIKEVACPLLQEPWTKEDDWYRLMLEVNLGRMKNCDPMQFIMINQDEVRKSFEAKIRVNAQAVLADIQEFRKSSLQAIPPNFDPSSMPVSDL